MERIILELKKFADDIVEFNPPVIEKLVTEFENKYNLHLPVDYKEFLKYSNGVSLMGSEVYGIGTTENVQNLEKVYQFEHFEVQVPQYLNLVPFSDDGRGGFYCFDCSKKSDNENSCPIIFWISNYIYTENDTPAVTNSSFEDFVKEVLIEWTLEDYDYDGNER